MGICRHCRKKIYMAEDDELCPNCGEPPYNCWSCQEEIIGNERECKICSHYHCANCGVCGRKCKKVLWMKKFPHLSEKEIIELYNELSGKEQKVCMRFVPGSSPNQLTPLILKMKGINVRSEVDSEEFEKRFNMIAEAETGTHFSITSQRDDGRKGIEEREAFYLATCFGSIKISFSPEVKKDGVVIKHEGLVFERINGIRCPYINTKKLQVKKCPNCKVHFDITTGFETCPTCVRKKDSKNGKKGDTYKLRDVNSKCLMCSLPKEELINRKIAIGKEKEIATNN